MPCRLEGRRLRSRLAAAGLIALIAASPALGQMATGGIAMGTLPARGETGSILAENGSVAAMAGDASDGAGTLTLVNRGTDPDRLLALSSPSSREVRVRGADVGNGNAQLELAAGTTTVLRSDGPLRLVFVGVSQPFAAGSQVALTLTFEKAGRMALTLPVLASGASGP